MLQKILRLTGLDNDLQQMSASLETRAIGMIDQARAMAIRSAMVVAIGSVALMMLMFAIAIGFVALYFYLAARYDPTTALAVVAGGLVVVVLILALVALSLAKSRAGAAPIGASAADKARDTAASVRQATDRAAADVADAARSASNAAEASATKVASAAQQTADSMSPATRQAAAAAKARADAAAAVGSDPAGEQPSLSAAADAIFRTFGSQVNNEKEFMSSTMSVLGHFVRTPKTGVGPIDDMIDEVSPRFRAVGEEAANQAAEYVRTSDRTTFWGILGSAAVIGFMVARNNNPPKA